MPKSWGSKRIEREQTTGNIITIDDAIGMAEALLSSLTKLGEYKHPLDVRRGVRKGVRDMGADKKNSRTVKAGSKTFFFDLLKAKNGNRYLKISESRYKGEQEENERRSIIIFSETAQEFAEAVSDMVTMLLEKK